MGNMKNLSEALWVVMKLEEPIPIGDSLLVFPVKHFYYCGQGADKIHGTLPHLRNNIFNFM